MTNDDFCNVVSSLLTQLEVGLADEHAVWKDICVSDRARAEEGKQVLLRPLAQDKHL